MDVFPQDLGDDNYASVLNARRTEVSARHKLTSSQVLAFKAQPLTPMRRLWMRGLGVDEQDAEHATPAFHLCNRAAVQWLPSGFRWTFPSAVAVAAALGTLVAFWLWPLALLWFGFFKPRRVLQEMHRRLSCDDLAWQVITARDPLLVSFFELVEKAVQYPPVAGAQDDIRFRQALSSLGNSIALLPPLKVVPENAAHLTSEAEMLELKAAVEPDQVVAASYQRRAEATHQRAQLADYTHTIFRRSQALRDELQEQVLVMETSLAAEALGSEYHAGKLAEVAAGIQEVAGRVHAETAAHAELEGAYARPVAVSIRQDAPPAPRRTL